MIRSCPHHKFNQNLLIQLLNFLDVQYLTCDQLAVEFFSSLNIAEANNVERRCILNIKFWLFNKTTTFTFQDVCEVYSTNLDSSCYAPLGELEAVIMTKSGEPRSLMVPHHPISN